MMLLCCLLLIDEPHTELEWCKWIRANKFQNVPGIEVPLWDKSRVDLLFDNKAVEVDWSRKWAEGVGQARFYSKMTNRKPALILLSNDVAGDVIYHMRAKVACGNEIELMIFDTTKREFLK